MKKLVSILTAGLITICCSLPVFAATSVTTTPKGDGSYTTSGNIDENQSKFVTIVVYEGGSISVDSIQYIDQTQADAEGNFSFDGYLPKEDVPNGSYYTVKIGATALTTPVSGGTIGTLPTGFTIQGKMSAQGKKLDQATVEAIPVSSGDPIPGSVSADGSFLISSVPSGTYTIVMKNIYCLTSAIEDVVINDNYDAGTDHILRTGDINSDKKIGFDDLSLLLPQYSKKSDSPSFNPACDLNDDTEIGFDDLNLLLLNYSRTGYDYVVE